MDDLGGTPLFRETTIDWGKPRLVIVSFTRNIAFCYKSRDESAKDESDENHIEKNAVPNVKVIYVIFEDLLR